jgi:hypothetical protein
VIEDPREKSRFPRGTAKIGWAYTGHGKESAEFFRV